MLNFLFCASNFLFNSYSFNTYSGVPVIDKPTSDFFGASAVINTGSTFDGQSLILGIVIGIVATLIFIGLIKYVKSISKEKKQDKDTLENENDD